VSPLQRAQQRSKERCQLHPRKMLRRPAFAAFLWMRAWHFFMPGVRVGACRLARRCCAPDTRKIQKSSAGPAQARSQAPSTS
jgi:hypothetical protein